MTQWLVLQWQAPLAAALGTAHWLLDEWYMVLLVVLQLVNMGICRYWSRRHSTSHGYLTTRQRNQQLIMMLVGAFVVVGVVLFALAVTDTPATIAS